MSRNSKVLLTLACVAVVASLVLTILPSHSAHDARDFTIGLSAALMLGVLMTWKRRKSPQS